MITTFKKEIELAQEIGWGEVESLRVLKKDALDLSIAPTPDSKKKTDESLAKLEKDNLPESNSSAEDGFLKGYAAAEEGSSNKRYKNAIRLNPENVVAYNNRACTYESSKEFDKALRDREQAKKLDS